MAHLLKVSIVINTARQLAQFITGQDRLLPDGGVSSARSAAMRKRRKDIQKCSHFSANNQTIKGPG